MLICICPEQDKTEVKLLNADLLKSKMALRGETQAVLARGIGMSLSRLNAKIKGWHGAEFTEADRVKIAARYDLTEEEVQSIFF